MCHLFPDAKKTGEQPTVIFKMNSCGRLSEVHIKVEMTSTSVYCDHSSLPKSELVGNAKNEFSFYAPRRCPRLQEEEKRAESPTKDLTFLEKFKQRLKI